MAYTHFSRRYLVVLPLLLVFLLGSLMPVSAAQAKHPLSWGGVFRSEDQGLHWIDISRSMQALTVLSLAVDGSALYAGTDVGLFGTQDNGDNWTKLEQGMPKEAVIYALAIADTAQGKRIYAGTHIGLYMSADGGKTWQASGDPDALGGILSLLVDPNDPQTIYAGGAQGVWRSSDGGETWAVAGDGMPHLRVYRLLSIPGTSSIFAASSGGLYRAARSAELLHWQRANAESDTPVYALAGTGSDVMAGGDDGLFLSTDGASWNRTTDTLLHDVEVLRLQAVPAAGGQAPIVYGGTDWGFYRSLDGGKTWSAPRDVNVRDVQIGALIADPAHPNVVYAGGSLVPYPNIWQDARAPNPEMPLLSAPAGLAPPQPTAVPPGIRDTGLGRNISPTDLLVAGATLLVFLAACAAGFVFLLRAYRRTT